MQPLILSNLLFLQNSKEQGDTNTNYDTLWFQGCIYWKKSVIWRNHFQPSISIFSIILSLFHGTTWSNSHVRESVFITLVASIDQNKRFVADSWKIEEYVYFRKTISPAFLKVPMNSAELIFEIIFVWKVLCQMHKSTYRDPILSW